MWPGLSPPADVLLRQLPEGGHIPGSEAQQIPAFLRGKGLEGVAFHLHDGVYLLPNQPPALLGKVDVHIPPLAWAEGKQSPLPQLPDGGMDHLLTDPGGGGNIPLEATVPQLLGIRLVRALSERPTASATLWKILSYSL